LPTKNTRTLFFHVFSIVTPSNVSGIIQGSININVLVRLFPIFFIETMHYFGHMTLRESFHGFAVFLKALFSANILPSKTQETSKLMPGRGSREKPFKRLHTPESYVIFIYFHRNRCVHFIPTVNDTISARNKVCPRKPCENTRAEKRPVFTGCLCWTACILRQISSFGNSCSLWDFL